jgi:hypothetical protein
LETMAKTLKKLAPDLVKQEEKKYAQNYMTSEQLKQSFVDQENAFDAWQEKNRIKNRENMSWNEQHLDDIVRAGKGTAEFLEPALYGFVEGATGLALEPEQIFDNPDTLTEKVLGAAGSLAGFLFTLKGVSSLTDAGKIAEVLSKLTESPTAIKTLTTLSKTSLDFTLLGQAKSFLKNENLTQHLETAGVDALSGIAFGTMGELVSKLPKYLQPLVEAGAWTGISKAQGASTEDAIIQGVLMGGLRMFGMSPAKNSMENILKQSRKVLRVKEGASMGEIRKKFDALSSELDPNSREYHLLEASSMVLMYPEKTAQLLEMFRESRLVGKKGKEPSENRPGIETPAPLPETQESLRYKDAKEVSQEAIDREVQYLKDSMKKGVTQGNIKKNAGNEVIGQFGRKSNNEQWYRDWYADHGYPPSGKQMIEIAKERLRKGDETQGLPPNENFIEAEKIITEYDSGKIPERATPEKTPEIATEIIPESKPGPAIKPAKPPLPPESFGVGKVKITRDIIDRAVEDGLIKMVDEGELPGYDKLNKENQAKQSGDLYENNPALFEEILFKGVNPPGDLLPISVFKWAEHKAWAENDVQRLLDITFKSNIPSTVTKAAQTVSAAGAFDPDNPAKMIKELGELREEALVRRAKDVKSITKPKEGFSLSRVRADVARKIAAKAAQKKEISAFKANEKLMKELDADLKRSVKSNNKAKEKEITTKIDELQNKIRKEAKASSKAAAQTTRVRVKEAAKETAEKAKAEVVKEIDKSIADSWKESGRSVKNIKRWEDLVRSLQC